MFKAHVEAHAEASHANGPVGHKCRGENDEGHGHSWVITIEFYYTQQDLNEYGWGPDFGQVKDIIRHLDHHNLNRLFTFAPSAENIGTYIYNEVEKRWPYVQNILVIVREGAGNSVTVTQDL